MTPQERAADWFTLPPACRTKEWLAAYFTTCENEAFDAAANRVMHSGDRAAILDFKT